MCDIDEGVAILLTTEIRVLLHRHGLMISLGRFVLGHSCVPHGNKAAGGEIVNPASYLL